MLRITFIGLLIALVWAAAALASPYDGMTAAEVRAHDDFVADDYSLSQTENSAEADGRHIYEWIGYIPWEDKRVYFTSYGEPLTCVQWEETGEWVPEWVVDALNQLVESGHIVMHKP